ncbi:hypothetical protein CDL12_23802 [Handroanthus impetiginosus]|uniref:Pentacotripeptide-repeat region of PRORP domain-containing protein n=1 Tax=Handroanthus impetiginosus TaxID=429701 RepID=A0A2G9GF82_9LAMI|nr:hypothetical protein CDL12_23802 [Handroanthus impetiginosus]
MITRQLRLDFLQKIHIQRSQKFKNLCSVYHGHHLLDESPKPPHVSVHRFMLNLLHQNRQGEALNVFKKHLQRGLSGIDAVAIALASKACVGRPKLGSQIHGFAIVSDFMAYVSVCNSLMNMYCKSRDLRSALCIFENLKNPDTVSYNTVLSGFEDSENALLFAHLMYSAGIAFDAVTFTSVLAHCADCEEFGFGFQLHGVVLKFGLKTEIFIGNALVTMYAKCGQILDADKMFDEMPHEDLVSWNAILSGYAQEGSYGLETILGFIKMVKGGMNLDHVSFTSVISACGRERNLDFGKQVHALSMKRGYSNHVSVCNVLMSMYSKCEIVEDAKLVFKNILDGNVVSWTTMLSICEDDAMSLFKFCIKSNFLTEINVANSFITMYGKFKLVEGCIKVFQELDYREVISLNALISAYSLNEMYQEALQMFLFASKELPPNPYTFGSVLHAIASSESISFRQGQRCHGYIGKLGLDTDRIVSGALLDMYAKRGSIDESKKIFDESAQKSQVSWTAIISAHARHGDYESVMKYFNEMVIEGIKPHSITFLSVRTSCGHNGIVDEGVKIFNSMINDHSVEPSAEHYSCIVDRLGRARRLNEAEGFLSQIPGGPGVLVLQRLLGSCRTYGNVDLAIRVSDALIAMEPNESGSYVLMSNLFAEKGKREKAAKMRRMMRERKVMKEVGFSWAGVENVDECMYLHGFSSGDKSHPLSKEIFMMAELLGAEMKRRRERRSDVLSLEI